MGKMSEEPTKTKQVWMSGYCRETVKNMHTIGYGQGSRRKRIEYLERHLPNCDRCQMANRMKNLEHDVAEYLTKNGHPTAMMNFASGKDSPVPYDSQEFHDAMESVMKDKGYSEQMMLETVTFLMAIKDGKEV